MGDLFFGFMKKIRDKDTVKEDRTQKTVLSIVIAVIMVSSVLGYFGSRPESVVAKGHKFTIQSDGTYTTSTTFVLTVVTYITPSITSGVHSIVVPGPLSPV